LSAVLYKNYSTKVTKFGEKMAHELLKKPLDFGSNLDHITLGLEYVCLLGV